MMPIVWTREYKNPSGNTNRTLCGVEATTDLENESLRRLLVEHAVYWGWAWRSRRTPTSRMWILTNDLRTMDRARAARSDLDLGKAMPEQPLPKPASAENVTLGSKCLPRRGLQAERRGIGRFLVLRSMRRWPQVVLALFAHFVQHIGSKSRSRGGRWRR